MKAPDKFADPALERAFQEDGLVTGRRLAMCEMNSIAHTRNNKLTVAP